MQACAGPGKSAVLAWIGWLRMQYCSPGEHPKGAALAKDRDNLRDNLWAELAKWQARSQYLSEAFTWTSERIYANDHPKTWFLSSRSWSKDANAEEQGRALSGLHSPYAFVLIDESATIPLSVARTAEQIMTTVEDGFIGQAGNPTSRKGMLYDACVRARSQWHVIEITSDPDDPMRSTRVSADWARQQIALYGRDDSWVMAMILGKFPPGGINQLLTLEEVDESMGRSWPREKYEHFAKILGVDVAREGLDVSIIYPRQGRVAFQAIEFRDVDNIGGAAVVARKWAEWGAKACFIDDGGGFGGGWIDQLRVMGFSPMPVKYAGKASDPRFANKRAEMYWRLRQWVREGGQLPKDTLLREELTEMTYGFQLDKLLMEKKELLKERLKGRSPNRADALAQTFAYDVPPDGLPGLPPNSVFAPTPRPKMALRDDPTQW